MKRLAAITAMAAVVSACGGPELTKEATQVRSVTDASACRFIESSHLESRPALVQDYVKRNVAEAGGNAFKIINVSQDQAVGVQIAQVSYEAYDCPRAD
jgi:hypothetical protein